MGSAVVLKIRNITWAILSSKVLWLFIFGVLLISANHLDLIESPANWFTTFLRNGEVLLHLGIAFFIALILEVVNERALRTKIARSAKASMSETLSQVVKVLTKSDVVGRSLDDFMNQCMVFFRDNYLITITIFKKSKNNYLLEYDYRYDLVNQTPDDQKYSMRYGGDGEISLKELYLDGKPFDIPKVMKAERHGILGKEYKKVIKVKGDSRVNVRFVSEKSVDLVKSANVFNVLTFDLPSSVVMLKIVLDKNAGIDSEDIKVLTRGTPNPKKGFGLEYSFDNCFLPTQAISIYKTNAEDEK